MCAPSNMVTTGHLGQLHTWNVANDTEELNFQLYLILI